MNSVEEYIASFPAEIQAILNNIRDTIRKTAPDAVESISWQMPTYKLNGRPLIYFAAHKNHVGVYPVPAGIFDEELGCYKQSGRGTVQFPYNKPVSLDLIAEIVKFRMDEQLWK